jgi:hypothetical protein
VLPYAAPVCGVLGHNRMSFGGVLAKVILSPVDSFARDVRYQKLNNLTCKDLYLIPRIDELLARPSKAKIFTKFNI